MYPITTLSGYFAVVLFLASFAVLAWRRFAWAAVAALAFIPAAALRFSVGPVPFSVAEALALILVFRMTPWAFSRSFWAQVRRVVAPIAIPAGLIVLGLAVSLAQSAAVARTGLGILKGWFVVPMLFGILGAVAVRRGAVNPRQVLAGLVAGGAMAAFGAVTQLLAGNLTYDNRLAAWYESPNYLAMYLAPLAALAFGLGARGSGIADEWRTLSRWAGVLMAVPLLATQSWGAIGALFLAFGAGLWFSRSGNARRRRIMAATLLVVVLAGFVFQALQPAFTTRRVIWQVAFEIGRDHPLWGIGPGAFQQAYLAHQPRHPPYPEWAVPHPHNVFLAFWLEAGFLGLAGFAWLLVVLVRRLRDAFSKINPSPCQEHGVSGNEGFILPKPNMAHPPSLKLRRVLLAFVPAVLLRSKTAEDGARPQGIRQRRTDAAPFLGAVGLALFVPVAHGFLDTTILHGDLAMVWWVLVWVFSIATPDSINRHLG